MHSSFDFISFKTFCEEYEKSSEKKIQTQMNQKKLIMDFRKLVVNIKKIFQN